MRKQDYDQFKERMKSYEEFEMCKKNYDEFNHLMEDVIEFTRFICNDCFTERRIAQFKKKGLSGFISYIETVYKMGGTKETHIAISFKFDLDI